MKKINLTSVLYNLLFGLMLFAILSPVNTEAAAFVSGGYVVLGTAVPAVLNIYYPEIGFRNEVLKQLFSSDIQEKLYPKNDFFAGAQSDAAAIDVEKIIIPQDENGSVTIHVNPQSFPLPANITEDTRKEYSADLLVTAPEIITYNTALMLSYPKREVKLRKHTNELKTSLANRILYGWSPNESAQKVLTTGTSRTATAPGATGNRKKITEQDILDVMTKMTKQEIPMEGRRCVIDPVMFQDLLAIHKAYGAGAEWGKMLVEQGFVRSVFGFDIYVRSQVQVFTEATDPLKKAPGAATAATDNLSALFYHPQFVRYIEGSVLVNMDTYNKPELAGGRSMNVMVRGGGATSYLSEIGVVALVEDNA